MFLVKEEHIKHMVKLYLCRSEDTAVSARHRWRKERTDADGGGERQWSSVDS